MTTLKTRKKTHEVISPAEYVRRFKQNPQSVSGAKIVAPTLGARKFGSFVVELERPLYEVVLD